MRICLDAGHGGHDAGADGPNGLDEAPVVLAICEFIATILVDLKMEVKLTRTSDVFVELEDRCHTANTWGADYFISVHCNSDGPTAVGIETLYTTNQGQYLAVPIQSAMIHATGDRDRGLKERNDLYVLNGTEMPAILAEVGFISHPETEAKLKTTEYQQLLAKAIATGLCEYLDWPPTAPATPPPLA